MFLKELFIAAVLTAHPLANEDVLEPSIYNEVDHALSRAPTNAPPTTLLPFATNDLSKTQLAIRLVSSQGSDGRWLVGTNDVTTSAIKLLKEIIK